MTDPGTTATQIDTPNAAYTEMRPTWDMVDALMGGTASMRAAGRTYLPQEPKESDDAYSNRLSRSVLYEGYKRSVDTLTGRPLMETISFTDDMAQDVQDWMNDVDLQGNDINVFARDVFHSAINRGLTHILVDYPRTGGNLRLDQQRREGVRPYWVHIDAKDLIAWRTERQGHKHVLTHARFLRSDEEQDGEWGTVVVERIHALDLNYDPDRNQRVENTTPFVLLRVYRKNTAGNWDLEETEKLTIGEIPLVTVYTNKTGFMVAEPAFLGVAYLNVAHWQSSSDQRNILHVCRVPLLFGRMLSTKGEDGSDIIEFEVGPNRLVLGGEGSDLRYVEHTGAAIDAGAKDLENLKDEMATLAMEVMTKRSGSVTATEKAIDTAAANGALIGMVRNLQASLNKALTLMGKWINRDDMGMLDVNTDFRVATDAKDLEVLWKARLEGDLSIETFWNECLRRGTLSEDFDEEEEKKRLTKEAETRVEPVPPAPVTTVQEEEELTGAIEQAAV